MKIGMKIGLAVGGVIVLLLFVSFTGIKQLMKVKTNYSMTVMHEVALEKYSHKIPIYLLQVRRREKDFMSRRDVKDVDEIMSKISSSSEQQTQVIEQI